MVNRPVIVSVVILMAAGAYRMFVMKAKHVTLTRLLLGGYMLVVFVSILDLVSDIGARISGALLGLAVATALVATLPDLFARFSGKENVTEEITSSTPRQGA